MLLTNSQNNTVFASGYSLDKIVKVLQGTFDAATDVVGITYTFAGFPYTVYFHRIAHGLPRPVFTELLWSTDNSTYIDGGTGGDGAGNTSIAFSDSTYVYIQRPVAAGTVYFKVLCSWIDNYDSTAHFIDISRNTPKPVLFDSRLNFQKIYDQDVRNVDIGASATTTIIHPLGYIPNAKVFFESMPGQVWPLSFGGLSNPYLYDDTQLQCSLKITSSNIQITTDPPFGATGTRRVWYRIYMDS